MRQRTEQLQGDEIDETRPIITNWVKQQLKTAGRPTDFCQEFYEYDGPEDVQAPLYLSHGKRGSALERRKAEVLNKLDMQLHARLEVSLDATLRLKIPIHRGMDGNDY